MAAPAENRRPGSPPVQHTADVIQSKKEDKEESFDGLAFIGLVGKWFCYEAFLCCVSTLEGCCSLIRREENTAPQVQKADNVGVSTLAKKKN